MSNKKNDIYTALEALRQIDPAALGYETWLKVGMALKSAGATLDDWDTWSRKDTERYDGKVMASKWESFHGGKVGIGTLVLLCKEQGGRIDTAPRDAGHELDFDAVIGPRRTATPEAPAALPLSNIDLPPQEGQAPATLHPYKYFDATGALMKINVRIEQPGRPKTFTQRWAKTATAGDGPMTWEGINDRTRWAMSRKELKAGDFAHGKPEPLYREAELATMPPDAVLYCCEGEKDADNAAALGLFVTCHKAAGGAEKDPAKWAPFVTGRRVIIIRDNDAHGEGYAIEAADAIRKAGGLVHTATPPGVPDKGDFTNWREGLLCEAPTIDDAEVRKRFQAWALPPALDDPADFFDNPVPEAPEVIYGIIREGEKMLISGASKAGKSFALIQLAAALAEGHEWLGTFQCRQSKVLYYNFEITRAGFQRRVIAVYGKLFDRKPTPGQLKIENMRGQSAPLAELIQKVITTAKWHGVKVVLFDPVYKMGLGEENAAEAVQAFFAAMDLIANEGIAVILVHHFSKAATDRARSSQSSGSGVFQRDPDAGLTLTKLNAPDGDGYMLDFDLRGFRNPDPVPLRWKWPIHEPAPEYATLRPETPQDSYKKKATTTAQGIDAGELFGDAARLNKTEIEARLTSAFGVAQRQCKGVIDAWLLSRDIVEDTSQKWQHNARWFYLPGKEGGGAPPAPEPTPEPIKAAANEPKPPRVEI